MSASDVHTEMPRILVVDDEPEVVRAFCRVLKRDGFEVETATDGRQAVETFKSSTFHAVVSDIAMPEMDGVELLKAIREHDLDVPVILITGEPSIETAIEALDYGALRYMRKPVDHERLGETVRQAINLYRMAVVKREALKMAGGLDKQVGDRAGLEVKFESALEQLYSVYQPIVRWSERRVVGYESLVRTREPTIPHPGALFDAAERLERIGDVSRAVRKLAPAPMLDAPEHGTLFFNLHVTDLDDESLFDTAASIAKMADRVVLEVTERASLAQVSDVRSRVSQLREMGFEVAVDDLGAGYAGLNSFALLEPDVVKLDMALVRDIHETPTKQKLVRSMIELCEGMGQRVVGEGIECAEERDTLYELGCDLFQGFLFAKPDVPFPVVNWGDERN